MNMVKKQSSDTEDAYALALCAVTEGIWMAKNMADHMKIAISKETLLGDIELFFGPKVAAEQRIEWGDESIEDICDSISLLKAELDAELRHRHARSSPGLQHLTSNFLIKVTRTANELLNALNPAQWQSTHLPLMGATRGGVQDAKKSDSKQSPEIDPSLSLEDDILIVWLSLRSSAHTLPETKAAILLFVDGEQVQDFEFHRDDDQTIGLEVKVNSEFIVHANEKDITLHYNPELKKIAVVVGKYPLELP